MPSFSLCLNNAEGLWPLPVNILSVFSTKLFLMEKLIISLSLFKITFTILSISLNSVISNQKAFLLSLWVNLSLLTNATYEVKQHEF